MTVDEISREFAEKIIAEEYSAMVISLMDENGICKNYFRGSVIMNLGMVECARQDLLRKVNTPADDEL